jgi:osmotically-inducible protein OsmY
MPSDAQIGRDLELRLFRLNLGDRVRVRVSRGVAILNGEVPTFHDKIDVERAVREDRRIRRVKNMLRVITEIAPMERSGAG